jgi:hypothetical protein
MNPHLTPFHRLAVPAALIAAGLALHAGPASAAAPRDGIDVSIRNATL